MHKREIMPRPALPPTPASSTDIAPTHPPSLTNLELSFTLPPPAIGNGPAGRRASGAGAGGNTLENGLDKSMAKRKQQKPLYPPSPPSPKTSGHASTITTSYPPIAPMPAPVVSSQVAQKKRPSVASAVAVQKRKDRGDEDLEDSMAAKQPKSTASGGSKNNTNSRVTLPPPPGRSRKIIQMKPKAADGQEVEVEMVPNSTKSKQPAAGRKKAAQPSSATIQPNLASPIPTAPPAKATAATRKTARKTAHSLIERRRRFKMNAEFGVLKSMIPACNGVEMHKLAILQASIEYLKYLEECVERLKNGEGIDEEGEMLARAQKRMKMLDDEEEEEDRRMDGEEDDEDEYEEANDASYGAAAPRNEDESLDDGRSQFQPTRGSNASFTFVHHQLQSPQPNRHQQYQKANTSVSVPSMQLDIPQNSFKSPSELRADQASLPNSKYSGFVPTQKIPPQLLPPPALSTHSPTAFKYPASLEHPQTIELHHHHHQHHHHKPPPSYAISSTSNSTVTSPQSFLPKPFHGDVDREATHALLLLAGDVDGDTRRKASLTLQSGSTGQGSGPQPSADVTKGRTMSVMDMLSS